MGDRANRPDRVELTKRHLRVLAADDSRFQRQWIERLLSDLGAAVEWAFDGGAALDAGSTALEGHQPYDLILLDMQMPEMDGYEVAAALREVGDETPMIAVTSHDRSRFDGFGAATVFDAYLQKPVDPRRLEQAMKVALGMVEDRVDLSPIPELLEVCRRYIGSLGELRHGVWDAKRAHKWEFVQRIAHQTRGNARSCGLHTLSDCAGTVEDQIKETGKVTDEVFERFIAALDRAAASTVRVGSEVAR